MVKLFGGGWRAVTLTTDVVASGMEELTNIDTPLTHLPKSTNEYSPSIGDDCNLPLLVRELGGRKKEKLSKRREAILKELEGIVKELEQLDVLLEAANSL
jgi:ribosome assembly protein YihI (activator of Der GTPase)